MRIKKFELRHKASEEWTAIDLDANVCLFYSANNSTGKTTLMRSILYCFGFQIPNTERVKFENYEFKLTIEKDGVENLIYRKNQLLKIDDLEFDLPADEMNAVGMIFGIENLELIENLLGTIYFDQDKGWTLLNRGKIIGNNRFTIESFFRGLNDVNDSDSYNLQRKIREIDREIDEFNLLGEIGKYQENLIENATQPSIYEFDITNETRIVELKLELEKINKEINEIKGVINDNQKFYSYLEQKEIYVNNPYDQKQPIRVTRHTLYGLSDITKISETRLDYLLIKREKLKQQINDLIKEESKNINLFDIPSLGDQISQQIKRMESISVVQVNAAKKALQDEKSKLQDLLLERTKRDNHYIEEAIRIIETYYNEMNIESVNVDIFTRTLKTISGAILHKKVFIFKLAYIKLLSEKLGYCLPIFCDSPNGREIEQSTVEETLKILRRDFPNHQIFISSINEYQNIFKTSKKILLDGTLFDPKNALSLFD